MTGCRVNAPNLAADRGEVSRFVTALFLYADQGTFASLRAFDQKDRSLPPTLIKPVAINGDLTRFSEEVVIAIDGVGKTARANVFAPPIATFLNDKRARAEDIANGLTISVELDECDTRTALKRLEGLLGPATLVMESGGEWIDPGTGEIHKKLHAHWRLSEPTRDDSDHQKLAHARRMAAMLVGADPTGAPVAHPYRWAGSWNLKSKPRLAHVVTCNPDAEVHLVDAVEALEDAVERAGLTQHADIPRGNGVLQAPLDILQAAMQAFPNNDVHYNAWVRIGYAIWAATGGSPDGFAIWDEWSQKSAKYDANETERVWHRIGNAKPNKIGAGTIFFEAKQNGWTRPKPKPDGHDIPDISILRLNRRAPPSLPLNAFGHEWRTWIEQIAEAACCPPDYVVGPLLASASALIGNARWAQAWQGWEEPPHLWVGSVGDSGDGKSPGADALFRHVLPELELRMCLDFPDQHREWKAAAEAEAAATERWKTDVRQAQKDGHAPPLPPATAQLQEPQSPRLRQNDVTIERVATLLATAAPKGLLMVRDELAGFLLGMTAYNDAARPFWLEAYGGRQYRVERQKLPEPIVVPRLAVSWFGTVQPERLSDVMRDADDGLLARFVWLWPEPIAFNLPSRTPGIEFSIRALDRLRLLDMQNGSGERTPLFVPMTEAAQSRMVDFARDMQKRRELSAGLLRSTYGKVRGLVLRTALVLDHLWWCAREGLDAPPNAISEAAAEAAILLVREYILPMADRVYGDAACTQADRNISTLARWIAQERPSEIRVRQLQRGELPSTPLPGLKDAPTIHATAKALTEAGWLQPPKGTSGSQGGRPPAVYPVNPELWAHLP